MNRMKITTASHRLAFVPSLNLMYFIHQRRALVDRFFLDFKALCSKRALSSRRGVHAAYLLEPQPGRNAHSHSNKSQETKQKTM